MLILSLACEGENLPKLAADTTYTLIASVDAHMQPCNFSRNESKL